MAQLPLYHSTSGKLQYGANRKSFSFRDKHLLLIILAVFAIICLGSLYYAPEVMEQVSFDTTYRRFIGLQDETNVIVPDDAVMDDQVSPSKIPLNDKNIGNVVARNEPDDGVPQDAVADSLQNEVVDQNPDEHQEHKEQSETVNIEHNNEENAAQPDNKDYVNIENRNSDPVVTQRREKVKEVCTCDVYMHIYNVYVTKIATINHVGTKNHRFFLLLP